MRKVSLRLSLFIECVMFALVIFGGIHTLSYLNNTGKLPQPFFINANDTLMDWINPAYWAHNRGAYFAYESVYPPLSFVFLKFFSFPSCYRFDNIADRDCDWLAPIVLLTFYAFAVVAVFGVYWKRDRRTAIPRTCAIVVGLPMLYALERGNLIVVCFLFFVLAEGRLLRSRLLKAVSSALMINFKPYLLLTLAAHLIKRRWRWVEAVTIWGLVIYLVTFGLYGDGTPGQLIQNEIGFGAPPNTIVNLEWSFFNSTYITFYHLIQSSFDMTHFVGSQPVELMEWWIPTLIHIGEFGVMLCFLGALWKPGIASTYRLTALSIAVVLTSTNAGGYSQVLLFFLVLMERWEGPATITAIIITYILSVPVDIPITTLAYSQGVSWLTNRVVGVDIDLTVGQIVRPALVLIIQYALICATLSKLGKEVFQQIGQWRRGSETAVPAGEPA
jgi:hypothetical protein